MKNLTLSLIVFFTISLASAQDVNQAGALYNEGVELTKAKDYTAAKTKYEECLIMCEKIGVDADAVKANAEKQIPYICYKQAYTLYKNKKLDEAVAELEKTVELSEKYNNEKYEKKALSFIPKIYNSQAFILYKEKKFDEALSVIEKAIALNPEYAKAFLTKGMIYNKQGNILEMKSKLDKAIELDNADKKVVSAKAKKIARNAFIISATKAIKAENYIEATKHITTSFEYDTTRTDAYYYAALAYNRQEDFENAAKFAQDGLDLMQEDAKINGNLQFELGNALVGLGKNGKACIAFKAAMSGSNAEVAKYQIEQVLECK